jgi:hypothetical protein
MATRSQVDDRQPSVAEPGTPVCPRTFVVWPAVDQNMKGFFAARAELRMVFADDGYDAAHGSRLALLRFTARPIPTIELPGLA